MKQIHMLNRNIHALKPWLITFCLLLCWVYSMADTTIAAGTSIDASAISSGTGILTINGTLNVTGNISLTGYTSVVINGPAGQIYIANNKDLTFSAGTQFVINTGAPGVQPTGGSASTRLIIGSTVIAVSNTNANNAAYSFADFNAQGGLPTFTINVSPSSPACGSLPVNVTVTPSSPGVNPFTYSFLISPNTPVLSPASITTKGAATTQFTPPNTTQLYTITCNITATGDPLSTRTLSYTVNSGPTVYAGSAIPAICQGGTTSALGGSFGGGATAAIWSDGAAGGSFTNNGGSTPNTATYSASATAPSTVILTLTTVGGTCNTYAGKTITVNPLPSAAGSITGTGTVCQGQTGVSFSVPAISNATGYSWSVPAGATIATGSNTASITVNYPGAATGGNISVYGTNACGNGTVSPAFALTVNPLPAPAGSVTGAATVCQGQTGVSYSVPAIPNATGYLWSLPAGATIATGSNTPSITVNYSGTAADGIISVYGTNACGNGTVSQEYVVTVYPSSPGTAYWTGTVSTDWCNAGNWACAVVPDANTNAVILATAPNFPTINCANESVKDIDLQGSSTLTIPSNKTFSITGSIINSNSAQYSLLGTINFAGGNQTIPAFNYNGLTISGSGSITKTLAGPATVNGTLTLTNGILVTGNSNMLTVLAAGNITGYSDHAFIRGPLTRLTNSAGAYDFPVGNGSLRFVTITPATSSAGSYTVKYNASAPTISSLLGNVGGVQVNEFWDINRNSGPDVVVGIDYINPNSAASWSSGTNPCSTCNVAVVQGIVFSGNTNWNFTGSADEFGPGEASFWQSNGTVFSRQVSNFGQFGFGYAYAVILPVTLEYFNGRLNGNDAELTWKFVDATGLSEAVLEHGSDGIHFSRLVTFVKDQNKHSNKYDAGYLSAGIHYYRLRMVSSDGIISYSKIISLVTGPGISNFHGIRPTVASGDVFIDLYSATSQNIQFSIFDVHGRLALKGKKDITPGENHYRFFAGGLNKGWYYVRVTLEDGGSATFRFVRE